MSDTLKIVLFSAICLLLSGCTSHNKKQNLSTQTDSIKNEIKDDFNTQDSLRLISSINEAKVDNRAKNSIGSCWLYPTNKYVKLYSNPKGNVIDSIANDSIKDNYVILYILKTEKEYFYVDAVYTQDLIDATYAQDEPSKRKQKAKSHLGWIEKKGNLYIQLVGYADNVVFLYNKPSNTAKIADSIANEYWSDNYFVSDCQKDWLQIEYKGRKLWVRHENICDDIFTAGG